MIPEAGQERITQRVVRGVWIGLGADPNRHVTVTIVDVVEVSLIDDDRAGELEHHVVVVTTNVVDNVLIA